DVVPTFTEWKSQGEMGRRKLAQVTRYGTVALAFIQAIAMSIGFNAMAGGLLITDPNITKRFVFGIVRTSGTAFLLWLGEQFPEHGVGNGIAMMIFVGSGAATPNGVKQLYSRYFIHPGAELFLHIVNVALIALVVV